MDFYIAPQEAKAMFATFDATQPLTSGSPVDALFSLAKADRDKIDAEDFAGPGRSYPIDSQAHLDAAAHLIGKADDPDAVKAKAIAIAKRRGLKLPETWETKDDEPDGDADDAKKAKMAMFASGEMVERTAKYFECGKQFTDSQGIKFGVTEDEADRAIAAYTPQPLNLQHIPTVLDGALGQIKTLFRQGRDIMAKISIPRELHDLTGGKPIPLSSEWEIPTKQARGAALVLKPAVSDAVMMSAVGMFAARHDTREGQSNLQMVHDIAARAGAVCKAGAVKMASSHESKAMQAVHDTAVEHGAACSDIRRQPTYFCAPMEPEDETKPALPAERTITMNLKERLNSLFKKAGEPEITDDELAKFGQADPALVARMAKLEEDNKALRGLADKSDGALFAETVISANKALPSERDDLVAEYCQASSDDRAHPAKVTFAALEVKGDKAEIVNKDGSRVDALLARYARKPVHKLFEEVLRDGLPVDQPEVAIFANRRETPGLDGKRNDEKVAPEAEQKRLMGMTPLGRDAAAAAAKNGAGK